MARRREPQTLSEVSNFAAIQPKTVALLTGIGINQAYAALHDGTIPGAFRVGKRILVRVPVFLEWLGAGEAAERAQARILAGVQCGIDVAPRLHSITPDDGDAPRRDAS